MKALSRWAAAAVLIALFLVASRLIPAERTAPLTLSRPGVAHRGWGLAPNGQPAEIYLLRNAKGMEARITTYGATIISLSVPDRAGHMDDVVLGFDTIEGYLSRAYLRDFAILWRGNRPLRQSDQQRAVSTGRQTNFFSYQQSAKSIAWRHKGVRQGRLAGKSRRRTTSQSAAHLRK